MAERSRDNRESHMRLAHATPLAISNERTNERTYVDANTDSDLVQLSDVRAGVQANRSKGEGFSNAMAPGLPNFGERFPVIRSGEREPIPWDVRSAVYRRDGMRCVGCASSWDNGTPLELDHITPWSAGGSDDSTNLRTLCADCNTRRSNKQDGAHGRRYLPVTWWCIDCHGDEIDEFRYVSRPLQVRPSPPRVIARAGLTFAYCATCDINSYAEVTV